VTLAIEHAGLSDRGLVREENEDSWWVAPEEDLFLVSDGMGGHAGGAVASKIVVEVLPELLRKRLAGVGDLETPEARKQVEGAIAELSRQIREQTRDAPDLRGMGATVVLAMLRDTRALVAHLGDSRAYLLREGRLRQLTRDHTVVQLLLDAGEIEPGEAAHHPARGQLTRCVGMEGEPLPDLMLLDLEPGDRLLFCTDGLTGMLGDGKIADLLGRVSESDEACRSLVEAANQAGGQDNVTVVVAVVCDEGSRRSREPAS
jgi:protein phosphatase